MKSKIMVTACSISLSVLILVACTHRLIDFTVISSKNVDLSKASEFTRGSQRVEGEDTAYIILFFPTGIPNMKEAVDRALEKVPGAIALVDGVLYQKYFYIPPLFGMNQFVIEGTPLIDKSLLKSGFKLPSKYIVSFYDAKKEQKLAYLTKDEYFAIKAAINKNDSKKIGELLSKQE